MVTRTTVVRVGMSGADPFGLVFFATYWRWYADALEDLLIHLGHPVHETIAEGAGLPMVRGEIDYLAPLRLGDEAVVRIFIASVGRRSVSVAAEFGNRATGEPVARVTATHVLATTAMETLDVPPWIREAAGDG